MKPIFIKLTLSLLIIVFASVNAFSGNYFMEIEMCKDKEGNIISYGNTCRQGGFANCVENSCSGSHEQ